MIEWRMVIQVDLDGYNFFPYLQGGYYSMEMTVKAAIC